jgi:hypothetical protein
MEFTCVHCSARLRVRNPAYSRRAFACPECRRALAVVSNPRGFSVVSAENAAPAAPVRPSGVAAWMKSWRGIAAACGAACALALFALWLAHWADDRPIDRPNQEVADRLVADGEGDASAPSGELPVAGDSADPAPTEVPQIPENAEMADEVIAAELPAAAELDEPVLLASEDSERLDAPLDPEFAEEPVMPERVVDIRASLAQKIVAFDQPRDRPLSEVLRVMAEMVGAPIVSDRNQLGAAADKLDQPTGASLKNTTLGEILEQLLKPAGLAYTVEEKQIRIVIK